MRLRRLHVGREREIVFDPEAFSPVCRGQRAARRLLELHDIERVFRARQQGCVGEATSCCAQARAAGATTKLAARNWRTGGGWHPCRGLLLLRP